MLGPVITILGVLALLMLFIGGAGVMTGFFHWLLKPKTVKSPKGEIYQ